MRLKGLTLGAVFAALLCCTQARADEGGIASVVVLADSSLSLPLARIARDYSREHGTAVVIGFATAQDESGLSAESTAADVVISAKGNWIDTLKQQGQVDLHSETPVAGDQLALVGPPGSLFSVDLAAGFPIGALLLAMGSEPVFVLPNPETLPEGAVAREALRSLHVAAELEQYTVYPKARAEIDTLVTQQQAYGIMLITEARQRGLRVISIIPNDLYTSIRYRALALAGDNMDAARAFVQYLRTPQAKTVFASYGFMP